MKKLVLASVILVILSGCAITRITSIRDPEFASVSYQKILVVAPFYDIELRQNTEKAFQEEFSQRGINVLTAMQILPPTRNYSDAELEELLDRYEIDAILVVALADYWESKTYVPESSTTKGKVSVSPFGNSLYYNSATSKSGGYYISKPKVKFECRLFDVKTGKVSWMASTVTSGNAFARYTTLVNSLATTTIQKLIDEQITR